jgi:SAM-dependent methyltransferase
MKRGSAKPTPSGPHRVDYDEAWSTVYGDLQTLGPVHHHLGRLVAKELAALEYGSVFDVGCGPGHNFAALTLGCTIERIGGVDISKLAIDQARQRLKGDFRVADVQEQPLEGQWDLVFCGLIMEHLPDDEAALRNLRPAVGRWLVLTTIAGDFERYRAWDERVGHVRNYRRGELEAKLERTGFRVVRSIYWGWPFYSPIARTLQNRAAIGTGEFGRGARLVARILRVVYYLNSRHRGDILLIVAEGVSQSA